MRRFIPLFTLVVIVALIMTGMSITPALADSKVLTTISVGTQPQGVTVLTGAYNRVYVANYASSNISVIEAATNQVVGTIASNGTNPRGIAANSNNGKVYFTNVTSNNVGVIDATNNTVVATIPVGTQPNSIAVNESKRRAYVANSGSNDVSIIDLAASSVITTTAVGASPQWVATNGSTGYTFVTLSNNQVAVIDGTTNAVTRTIQVGAGPYGVAVDPYNNRIYVANRDGNSLSIIDGNSFNVITTIELGSKPYVVAVNPIKNRLYVSLPLENGIAVFDNTSFARLETVPDGTSVDQGLAIDLINMRVYASHAVSNTISVILDPALIEPVAKVVAPEFLTYYSSHDGLRTLGSPISNKLIRNGYPAQYFEKAVLEDHLTDAGITADSPARYQYGLLVDELHQARSILPVGGDVSTVDYGTISDNADPNKRLNPPNGYPGGGIYEFSDGSVFIPFTADLSGAKGHYVPANFWKYMNRKDLFPRGWLNDIGLPITEVMTATVTKNFPTGAVQRTIFIQAFQRTILTYDPANPADWQVERANTGTDYKKAFPLRVPD